MAVDQNNQNSVFTLEENNELDRVRELRAQLINHITASGMPDSPKEQEILNNILSSQETSINTRAGTRLKQKEISSAEKTKDDIIAMLKNLSGMQVSAKSSDREAKSIEVQTVEGQLELVENSDISEEFKD